jgi:hypothetical protein
MFSIPINQKLSEEQFHEFVSFCHKYKDYIYDLYFTCRMPPFTQDAMGDIIKTQADVIQVIETALHIQKITGIKVSATFNNIQVQPSQENLDLFLNNFEQLYAAGVRSATIPHTHWVATKQIQMRFPELQIKNTILRNVTRANEIAELAKAGFQYVNLDRDLMRDRDALKQCRRAADKFGIKLSLLGNEGCLGNCAMMDEHFQFNNMRGEGPAYFLDSISRVSCPKWDVLDPSVPLKTANIPPWREDWVELLDYVDVFKMHGRESITQIYHTMDIVKRYANNEEFLFNEFEDYLSETNLQERPIDAWRKIIKNCKFDCWDCNFCDKVYEARSGKKLPQIVHDVVNELVDSVSYVNNLEIPGLTSKRVQNLLMGLGGKVNTYLEVGSAMGATAAAVGVNDINIHCVDNWSGEIQPQRNNFSLPNNTLDEFNNNTGHIKQLTVHNSDMLTVDLTTLPKIDMFFYDGPHDFENTKKAVEYYSSVFSDTVLLIFDDANWTEVVKGAEAGVESSGLDIVYNRLLLNEVENPNMWWNGLYIMVVKK